VASVLDGTVQRPLDATLRVPSATPGPEAGGP